MFWRHSGQRGGRRAWFALSSGPGFTLIEMAIVMVVIGLVVSGGLAAVAPIVRQGKVVETNQKLDRIQSALKLYAIQNGCLPCPANGALPSTTAGNRHGEAQDSANAYYNTGCRGTGVTGCRAAAGSSVVPWVNLGLAEEEVTDAWGNRISYALSTTAANVHQENTPADGLPCPTLGTETTYSDGICRATTQYPEGEFFVNDADGTNLTEEALYVLISHGPDRLGGYAGITATQAASPAGGTTQAENADGDTPFVQDDPIDIDANYFDDITRWETAPVFVQKCGAFACGN